MDFRYSEGDNDWVPRTKRSGSRSGLGLNRVCVLRALGTVLRSLQTGIALNHFQWTIRGLCFLTGSFTYDCGTVQELRVNGISFESFSRRLGHNMIVEGN